MTCSSPAGSLVEFGCVMPEPAVQSALPAHTESSDIAGDLEQFGSLFSISLDGFVAERETEPDQVSETLPDGAFVVPAPASWPQHRLYPSLTFDFALRQQIDVISEQTAATSAMPAAIQSLLNGDESNLLQVEPAKPQIDGDAAVDYQEAFSARLIPFESTVREPRSAEHNEPVVPSKSLAQFSFAPKIAGEPADEAGANGQHSDWAQGENKPGAEHALVEAADQAATAFSIPPDASHATTAVRPATAGQTRPTEVSRATVELPAEPAPAAQPAREINIKVAENGAGANLRLVDRAGQVIVSVQAADSALAQSLRADLGDLVQKLETTGFRAEMALPAGSSMSFEHESPESGSQSQQPGDLYQRNSDSAGTRHRHHRRSDNLAKWADHWAES